MNAESDGRQEGHPGGRPVNADSDGRPDGLAGVEARIDGLDGQPIDSHPDALEAVHRLVVSELDALSGVGAPDERREG